MLTKLKNVIVLIARSIKFFKMDCIIKLGLNTQFIIKLQNLIIDFFLLIFY
jgi:hypothetical protein